MPGFSGWGRLCRPAWYSRSVVSTIEPLPSRASRLGFLALFLCGCAGIWTSCGAGLITGAIAGDRNRSQPPPVRPPSYQFTNASLPLYSRTQATPTIITLRDATFPTGSEIAVFLRGGNVEVREAVARGTSNQAAFVLTLTEFREEFGLITEPVVLSSRLEIGGRQVGESVPFRLLPPPSAVLMGRASPTDPVFVSANDRVTLEVELQGIAGTGKVSSANYRVLTQVAGGDVRELPATHAERVGDRVRVRWRTERSDRIGPLGVSIEHTQFGLSNVLGSIYYEPWLSTAPPRAGSVVGGELVTLVGRGLVPENADGSERFDDVQLFVERGSREVRVGSRLRRDLSASNRLVFALPPSPDGRPGLAAARLQVKVADAPAGPVLSNLRRQNLLVYGRRNPGFGPRGIPLTDRPLDIGFATLGATVGAPLDAVVLQSVGGVAQLDLLRSYSNGVFSGSGRFVAGAEPTDTLARDPRGLALGDYNGDGLMDLVVVHHGDLQRASAHHSVLLGRRPPSGPLELVSEVVADLAGGVSAFSLRMTQSPAASLFVLSDEGQPRLFASGKRADGSLRFRSQPLPSEVTDNAPFTCATRMDLNGDGIDDLLLGDASSRPEVVVALGNGNGGFLRVLRVEFDVPGYIPVPGSNAKALHGVIRTDTPERQVVLVLEGDELNTPGAVVTLDFNRQTGTLKPPRAGQSELFAGVKIATTALGRLDQDAVPELVISTRDQLPVTQSNPPVLLQLENGGYRRSSAGVDLGIEIMRGISKLSIGPAVVATGGVVRYTALFAVHESRFSGATEHRLSTLLASSKPLQILPADASLHLRPAPKATLLGRFVNSAPATLSPQVLDSAFVLGQKIAFERNDGLGGFTRVTEVATPRILPGSAACVGGAGNPTPGGLGIQATDAVAYLDEAGRVAMVDAGSSSRRALNFDLRTLADLGKRDWPIDSASRLFSAQVDGAGPADIVYQLVLRDPGGRSELHTVIGLLRGRAVQDPGEVPLVLPDDPLVVRLDGPGVGLALGDFAIGGAATLELAVAIPDTNRAGVGNHVRFCRFDPGSGNPVPLGRAGFVWSAANAERPVLIAGDRPVQVVAADFNRDSRADLAVVARGDNRVRLYLQGFGIDGVDVDVERFAETLQAAPALPVGVLQSVDVVDLNLDDLPDLLAVTDGGTGRRDFAFTYFTNDGVGGLRSGRSVPPIRTGNFVFAGSQEQVRDAPMSFAIGDLNNDGAPELLIGWDDVINDKARSMRVLFGGSR